MTGQQFDAPHPPANLKTDEIDIDIRQGAGLRNAFYARLSSIRDALIHEPDNVDFTAALRIPIKEMVETATREDTQQICSALRVTLQLTGAVGSEAAIASALGFGEAIRKSLPTSEPASHIEKCLETDSTGLERTKTALALAAGGPVAHDRRLAGARQRANQCISDVVATLVKVREEASANPKNAGVKLHNTAQKSLVVPICLARPDLLERFRHEAEELPAAIIAAGGAKFLRAGRHFLSNLDKELGQGIAPNLRRTLQEGITAFDRAAVTLPGKAPAHAGPTLDQLLEVLTVDSILSQYQGDSAMLGQAIQNLKLKCSDQKEVPTLVRAAKFFASLADALPRHGDFTPVRKTLGGCQGWMSGHLAKVLPAEQLGAMSQSEFHDLRLALLTPLCVPKLKLTKNLSGLIELQERYDETHPAEASTVSELLWAASDMARRQLKNEIPSRIARAAFVRAEEWGEKYRTILGLYKSGNNNEALSQTLPLLGEASLLPMPPAKISPAFALLVAWKNWAENCTPKARIALGHGFGGNASLKGLTPVTLGALRSLLIRFPVDDDAAVALALAKRPVAGSRSRASLSLLQSAPASVPDAILPLHSYVSPGASKGAAAVTSEMWQKKLRAMTDAVYDLVELAQTPDRWTSEMRRALAVLTLHMSERFKGRAERLVNFGDFHKLRAALHDAHRCLEGLSGAQHANTFVERELVVRMLRRMSTIQLGVKGHPQIQWRAGEWLIDRSFVDAFKASRARQPDAIAEAVTKNLGLAAGFGLPEAMVRLEQGGHHMEHGQHIAARGAFERAMADVDGWTTEFLNSSPPLLLAHIAGRTGEALAYCELAIPSAKARENAGTRALHAAKVLIEHFDRPDNLPSVRRVGLSYANRLMELAERNLPKGVTGQFQLMNPPSGKGPPATTALRRELAELKKRVDVSAKSLPKPRRLPRTGLTFTWDPETARRNFLRNGVTLEEAVQIFQRRCSQGPGAAAETERTRFRAVGTTDSGKRVAVTFLRSGEKLTILAARGIAARPEARRI